MGETNRLRELREARRLTVTALARQAGVSRQTIYSIEGDPAHNVSTDTMRRIAEALDVTLVDLYQRPALAAS